jgi:hypothetical protein
MVGPGRSIVSHDTSLPKDQRAYLDERPQYNQYLDASRVDGGGQGSRSLYRRAPDKVCTSHLGHLHHTFSEVSLCIRQKDPKLKLNLPFFSLSCMKYKHLSFGSLQFHQDRSVCEVSEPSQEHLTGIPLSPTVSFWIAEFEYPLPVRWMD